MKKGSDNIFKEMNIDWDELKKCYINKQDFEGLDEDDKMYLYIKSGTNYISTMNSVELFVREMERIIKNLVPEDVENLKVLLARLEDIDEKHIDDLSSDFINNTFTINDRKLRITLPEVGDYDQLEFKRMLIRQIKLFDKQSEIAIKVRDEIRERFVEDIPDNVKKLLTDVEKMDEWVFDYYKRKVETEGTSEADKEIFQRSIKVINESYDLTPIKDDLTKSIETRGKEATLKSFDNNKDNVVLAAINICARNKLNVPFIRFIGIEEILLGEEMDEKYKGLFLYFFARYIKNHKDDLTQERKLFISSLSTHLVLIIMHKNDEKIKKTFERIKKSVKELLDMIVDKKG